MTSINDLYFNETGLFSKSSAQIIVRAAKKMQKNNNCHGNKYVQHGSVVLGPADHFAANPAHPQHGTVDAGACSKSQGKAITVQTDKDTFQFHSIHHQIQRNQHNSITQNIVYHIVAIGHIVGSIECCIRIIALIPYLDIQQLLYCPVSIDNTWCAIEGSGTTALVLFTETIEISSHRICQEVAYLLY